MKLHLAFVAIAAIALASAADAQQAGTVKIAGIAFVDSSITGMGSRAKLPANAKIYPPGAEITGRDGCPTTQYRTDGLIVLVMDYEGRPTAGSVTITEHPAAGGSFERAPYYRDFDPGRQVQFLGPIFGNGSYDLKVEWGFAGAKGASATSSFKLKRNCPGL